MVAGREDVERRRIDPVAVAHASPKIRLLAKSNGLPPIESSRQSARRNTACLFPVRPRSSGANSSDRNNANKTTISRLYDTYADAERAVTRLEGAGVPHSDISIVANNSDNWYGSRSGKVDRDVIVDSLLGGVHVALEVQADSTIAPRALAPVLASASPATTPRAMPKAYAAAARW